MTKKVLVVGMLDSIHLARWLDQFKDQDIQFLLFPSSPHRRVRPELKALLQGGSKATYRLVGGARWWALPLWLADKLFGNILRGWLLRSQVSRFSPDFIHLLEFQNAGYIALRALKGGRKPGPRIIATNWGSDIYWFRRFPKHESKIRNLLAASDFYSAECQRDVSLALSLGFKGVVLPVIPNAGGFDDHVLSRPTTPIGNRNVIAIKGYDGWVGRAKVALAAVEEIADSISGLEVVVYSANVGVLRTARKVASTTGLQIKVHRKGSLTHTEMLDLFAKSKIYVGISESDGISTSLLESMAMGAIPVQTSTSCCDEWFQDSGVSVSEISVSAVAGAILRGLSLAGNQANSDKNREIVRQRANARDVFLKAKVFYQLD